MSEPLANQIAAGEVVERPASVVKELVENSLDAEATRVEVEIDEGGKSLVRVTDDGAGMTPEEALLSLRRHATSKVQSVEDLLTIGTLGFRGEALPSIASVSRFEMETRTPDAVEGVRVRIEGDAAPVVEAVGVPPGTRITVRDLFFNVPARRKFLRAVATESGRVTAAMTRFALGYPHVHFRLLHNGRKVLDLAPERSLRNRVFGVVGRKVATRLHPVRLSLGVEIEGLVSDPGLHRVNADGMYTYVNGRFIRDRLVQHAVTSAYGNLLDRGRYPYVVLYIRVPPGDLDVNVHPAKAEVRFVKSGEVHEAIVRAIRLTLADAPWLGGGTTGQPAGTATTARRPADLQASFALGVTAAEPPAPYGEDAPASGPALSAAPRPSVGAALRALEFRPPPGARPGEAPAAPAALPAEGGGAPHDHARPTAPPPATAGGRGFFGRMRYVGQARRTFLLCETDDALHVIDQHAAHERVTYESLREGFRTGGLPMQNLLFPLQIDVGAEEVDAVEASEETLLRLGFDVVRFGERTIAVRAVPALLAGARSEELVSDLVAELFEHGRPRSVEDRVDAIAARLACHGSVRGGDVMTPQEVQALLRQLDAVDFRANCPHGRPIVVSHPFDQVARWFERS